MIYSDVDAVLTTSNKITPSIDTTNDPGSGDDEDENNSGFNLAKTETDEPITEEEGSRGSGSGSSDTVFFMPTSMLKTAKAGTGATPFEATDDFVSSDDDDGKDDGIGRSRQKTGLGQKTEDEGKRSGNSQISGSGDFVTSTSMLGMAGSRTTAPPFDAQYHRADSVKNYEDDNESGRSPKKRVEPKTEDEGNRGNSNPKRDSGGLGIPISMLGEVNTRTTASSVEAMNDMGSGDDDEAGSGHSPTETTTVEPTTEGENSRGGSGGGICTDGFATTTSHLDRADSKTSMSPIEAMNERDSGKDVKIIRGSGYTPTKTATDKLTTEDENTPASGNIGGFVTSTSTLSIAELGDAAPPVDATNDAGSGDDDEDVNGSGLGSTKTPTVELTVEDENTRGSGSGSGSGSIRGSVTSTTTPDTAKWRMTVPPVDETNDLGSGDDDEDVSGSGHTVTKIARVELRAKDENTRGSGSGIGSVGGFVTSTSAVDVTELRTAVPPVDETNDLGSGDDEDVNDSGHTPTKTATAKLTTEDKNTGGSGSGGGSIRGSVTSTSTSDTVKLRTTVLPVDETNDLGSGDDDEDVNGSGHTVTKITTDELETEDEETRSSGSGRIGGFVTSTSTLDTAELRTTEPPIDETNDQDSGDDDEDINSSGLGPTKIETVELLHEDDGSGGSGSGYSANAASSTNDVTLV